jgi:hypothetical protein
VTQVQKGSSESDSNDDYVKQNQKSQPLSLFKYSSDNGRGDRGDQQVLVTAMAWVDQVLLQ